MGISSEQNPPVVSKVCASILRRKCTRGQLLVFDHADFPDAGIQLPCGRVEAGETPAAAVLREAREETALADLRIIRNLGVVTHDIRLLGLAAIHKDYYFQLDYQDPPPKNRIAHEHTPSDETPGPIAFRFYWVSLEDVPPLAGGLDEVLHLQ